MGPKGSKAKRPTPTKTKAVIIPRAPQNAIIRTPQGTVPVPPRDTLPVPLQDTLPIIPRDTTTTTSQDTDSIPPQDTVQTVLVLLQDTIPRIPHDIIIEILGHLASDSELQSIQACALISRSWVQPCQRHLFHTAVFTPANARAWLRTFPMQEVSPAHHVRVFRIDIGRDFYIPEEFFECIPSFTDVDKMTLLGSGWVLQGEGLGWIPLGYGSLPLWEPSCWKLPRSVTSLTISTGAITLVQVWDIMAQLPNLNDLALSWFAQEVRKQLPTTGTVLKGRFGGRLTLGGRGVGDDVINMLLEIPSGLRFAELEMECTENRLPPSAVRLAEVCGETLVKLSHRVVLRIPVPHDTFERSFDFSKFPNIREVTFGLRAYWRDGCMPWIPMALSTLSPVTSPRLSAIRLDFYSITRQNPDTVIADLRRIGDEICRIEREYEGRVHITVVPDKFQDVLDSLWVLEPYYRR